MAVSSRRWTPVSYPVGLDRALPVLSLHPVLYTGIEFAAELVGSFPKEIFDVLPFPRKAVYPKSPKCQVPRLRRRSSVGEHSRKVSAFFPVLELDLIPVLELDLVTSLGYLSELLPAAGPRAGSAAVLLRRHPGLRGPSTCRAREVHRLLQGLPPRIRPPASSWSAVWCPGFFRRPPKPLQRVCHLRPVFCGQDQDLRTLYIYV